MSDLVTIARIFDAGVARVVQSYLQANSIDAIIPDEMVLATQPFLGLTRGGYRILVPEHQAALAQRLLDEAERSHEADEQNP